MIGNDFISDFGMRQERSSIMKIIKQVGIIFSICALSVLIEQFLPFALPASVIGMFYSFCFC